MESEGKYAASTKLTGIKVERDVGEDVGGVGGRQGHGEGRPVSQCPHVVVRRRQRAQSGRGGSLQDVEDGGREEERRGVVDVGDGNSEGCSGSEWRTTYNPNKTRASTLKKYIINALLEPQY